jgi:hypothetical protein
LDRCLTVVEWKAPGMPGLPFVMVTLPVSSSLPIQDAKYTETLIRRHMLEKQTYSTHFMQPQIHFALGVSPAYPLVAAMTN